MSKEAKILRRMRANPAGIRFDDVAKVCDAYFGPARQRGGSHHIYRTPWPGNPRVNIQRGRNGMAKPYQVRQVIATIDRLEGRRNGE